MPSAKFDKLRTLLKAAEGGRARSPLGVALLAAGFAALLLPLAAGQWSLQLLALPLIVAGLADVRTFLAAPRAQAAAGATGAAVLTAASTLIFSPALLASGIAVLLIAWLVVDGVIKITTPLRSASGSNAGDAASGQIVVINGITNLLLAFACWLTWRVVNVEVAAGLAAGGYAIASGWRMLLSPKGAVESRSKAVEAGVHPDTKLGLPAHRLFEDIAGRRTLTGPVVRDNELQWFAITAFVLLAIHFARMQSRDTWLGMISPIVATAGDLIMTGILAVLVVLPLRLSWRRLSRPLERWAWGLRMSGQDTHMQAVPRALVRTWTDRRYDFSQALVDARTSVRSAATLALRLGLPLTILFVAVNPIWGFSWYFNTESWASGVYQKITELRVDTWRARMMEAVSAQQGSTPRDRFAVAPGGVQSGDFSFIVIGDTGEGDPSQFSLIARYMDLARQDAVKFLVISSDVIYPAGAMSNYERNFYLPFNRFPKPIYAIPGNHDWFDALEGFNANFLTPDAARAALAARVAADLHVSSTNTAKIEDLVSRAQKLRSAYGVDNGTQRAPFFEIQTPDFALLAIDTGIQRTIDDQQRAWLTGALERARGKFIMAVLGHPRFAGGHDTSVGDAKFSALYAQLEAAGVQVFMAGDTHDFEYYGPQAAPGGRSAHHFVNGGGGAYLSMGGALAWPASPARASWAFYPRGDAIRAKLDAETPLWKQPFWRWVRGFGAWPLSVETLSGLFDFNSAPFFQSLVEVRVERSRQRIVLALHGANGPIRWREMQTASSPRGSAKDDDPVEFIVAMKRSTP